MIEVDKKYRVVSVLDKKIFSKEPVMMLMVIERASITGFRIDGPTWDSICSDTKYILNIPKDKIRLIFDNIFEHGDVEYGIELLFNSNIIQRMLNLDYWKIEDTILNKISIDNIKTIGDFYYYICIGNPDNYLKMLGEHPNNISYINALNHIFNYCKENISVRFNYKSSLKLLKDAEKINNTITKSGLLYNELKEIIEYIMP